MKFEFTVPIKKYKQLIFVFGGASLLLGILIIITLSFTLTKPGFQIEQEFFGYLIFFPIFSFYALWFILGYETIIITEKNVELIKSNRIFTHRKIYPITSIIDVKTVKKEFETDKWIDVQRQRLKEKQKAFPFWRKMGQLKLILDTSEKTFFNGLHKSEVLKIQEEIKKEIEKRKHNIM